MLELCAHSISGGFATVGTKTFYWSSSEVIWEEALVGCDGNKTLAAVINQAEMDAVMQKSDTGKLTVHYFLWNSGLGTGESFSLLLLEWEASFKVRVNVVSPRAGNETKVTRRDRDGKSRDETRRLEMPSRDKSRDETSFLYEIRKNQKGEFFLSKVSFL